MMHLLRSMFVGYFIAIAVGAIAVANGYGPVSIILGVWFGGSVLSVVVAASITPFEAGQTEAASGSTRGQGDVFGPMRRDLTARELALWDADLAAEQFEADLEADRQAAVDTEAGRKTG